MNSLIIETSVKTIITFFILFSFIPLFIYLEQKMFNLLQGGVGRKGLGVLQLYADIIKFFLKEEVVPDQARKWPYNIAPIISIMLVSLPIVVIPLCNVISVDGEFVYPEIFRTDIGVFFIMIALIIGSYSTIIAGWASNSKFSILGSIRACAQLISYELPLLLAMLSIVFLYQTSDIHLLVQRQSEGLIGLLPAWGVFTQPLGCAIFFIIILVKGNLSPFDLSGNRVELVGGYHAEYSSGKFVLFVISDYLNVIILSVICALFFFGGYDILPGTDFLLGPVPLPLSFFQIFSLLLKSFIIMLFIISVKFSLPSFRYDQLMNIGWKKLFPLGVLNLAVTVGYVYLTSLI